MNHNLTEKDSARKIPHDDTALNKVAQERIEVDWDDVKGLCTPLAARVPVQVCHHPHLIQAHPDMSVTLGSTPESRAIGIALGALDAFPDIYKVKRRLHKGFLHILNSEWQNNNLRIEQTVFGYLPHDKRVITGKEIQYAVMRLNVSNLTDEKRQVPLFMYLGVGGSDCTAIYAPFTASPARWSEAPIPLKLEGNALLSENGVFLTFHADKSTSASFTSQPLTTKYKDKPVLNNCLRFDLALGKDKAQIIDFVISDTIEPLPMSELPAMQKLKFEKALSKTIKRQESLILPAMKLTTPDVRINEIYKALILSSLSLQFHDPENSWQIPRQTSCQGVWSWEFAHLAVPIISVGLHSELDLSLKYFIARQNGVGMKSANSKPRGNINSTVGSFTGDTGESNWLWMNETGSILWALAERFRYTRDVKWLKAHWKSIMAAWNWIQNERNTTRIKDEKGEKVRYWGLLPSGMPGDVDLYCYQFTFNDSFTWLGMSEIAKAAIEAKFPDAERLMREAEEYRQCILDTIQREEFVDPDTNLLFVPNTVFYRETPPDKRDPYWCADGPVQLFDVGILEPNDKRFPDMVEKVRHTSGILLGMAEHVGGGVEWYPNQTERSYFKCYLARNEIEKALLVLYSNLTYGMSNDTYQTTERFHTDDSNFTAFEPNGSGNGRNLDMLRRMVIDEQEPGKLWLLRGCPRRWFEPGKSIIIENAPTLFGKMSIHVKSTKTRITIDIETPDRYIPGAMYLVVRSPKYRILKHTSINGISMHVIDETIPLPNEKTSLHIVIQFLK